MQKNATSLLLLTTVALAGCSTAPNNSVTRAGKYRIESRSISATDLANIEAVAAESAKAAAQIEASRGSSDTN